MKLTQNPICERCAEEGRLSAATEVHHIIPVETGRTPQEKARLMFDVHNLRALCHECHVRSHTEMGRSGKAATAMRNARWLADFARRYPT